MRAEIQIYLKAMPSAAEVAGTESLDYGLTMETLERVKGQVHEST